MAPLPPPIGGLSAWTAQYVSTATAHGISVNLVNTSPGEAHVSARSGPRLRRGVQALRTVTQLRRALDGADVLHVATTWFWGLLRDGWFIRMGARRGVVPILHVHASTMVADSLRAASPRRLALLRRWLAPVAGVAVLSEELRGLIADLLPDARVVVVPNAVDIDRFRPVPRPSGTDQLDIVFVGRLTNEKGFVDLARAVASDERLRLTSVGDRPSRRTEEDRRQVDDALALLAGTGRHENRPLVAPADMPAAYAAAGVFALPSWNEGLPVSLLEAMASGLPCVITPVGAMAELAERHADDPFALVVAPRSADELAAALGRLAADPELRDRLGRRGRSVVEADFSPEASMAQLRSLYAAARTARPTMTR